ncbi:MAG TPA: response regulator [Ktedonobacterales bacterium]|nr:response regulator [Ktedonobacterales bacterium]
MGLQSGGSRGDFLRLLVVDDIPDTATNVQKLLHFERDIRVVGVAASGREALQKADQLRPDVILMDINLRDMDGLEVAEAIMRQWPTCIVMMSVQSEPEYFNQAMAVGARGYLVKPFTSERLIRTLRKATENFVIPRAPMTGAISGNIGLRKIVAVYSPKGGVGTSVLAANLAISIQQTTQKSVVLVDANLQNGDAHVLLNVNTSSSIDDLREASELDQDIINSTIVKHAESEIGLLRAPLAPESAEMYTSDTMRAILVELRDHFDYVVVDTGSSYSEATLTVLEEADIIIGLTTLEVTAIHRVSQFFQIADRVGIDHSKIRLICNRVEQYYGIKPNQVESQLRRRFLAQIPEDEKLVIASTNRGVPFIITQRGAPISRSIAELAKRVHEVLTTAAGGDQQKRSGWSLLGN